MPLYEFECEVCGSDEDRICSYEEARQQICSCGGVMAKRLSSVKLIGPTPTKPFSVGGKSFESQTAVDRYMSTDGKGTQLLSKNDRRIVDKKYKLKHMIEERAQAAGYRSEKHRQTEVKRKARSEGVTIG